MTPHACLIPEGGGMRMIMALGAALLAVVVVLALGTQVDRHHQSLPAAVKSPTK